MKATFFIRNLSEDVVGELADMSPDDRFTRLHRWAFGNLRHCVSVQFGKNNAFQERMAFDVARKEGASRSTMSSRSLTPRPAFQGNDAKADLDAGSDTLTWSPNFTAAANEDHKGYHAMLLDVAAKFRGESDVAPLIFDGWLAMKRLKKMIGMADEQ